MSEAASSSGRSTSGTPISLARSCRQKGVVARGASRRRRGPGRRPASRPVRGPTMPSVLPASSEPEELRLLPPARAPSTPRRPGRGAAARGAGRTCARRPRRRWPSGRSRPGRRAPSRPGTSTLSTPTPARATTWSCGPAPSSAASTFVALRTRSASAVRELLRGASPAARPTRSTTSCPRWRRSARPASAIFSATRMRLIGRSRACGQHCTESRRARERASPRSSQPGSSAMSSNSASASMRLELLAACASRSRSSTTRAAGGARELGIHLHVADDERRGRARAPASAMARRSIVGSGLAGMSGSGPSIARKKRATPLASRIRREKSGGLFEASASEKPAGFERRRGRPARRAAARTSRPRRPDSARGRAGRPRVRVLGPTAFSRSLSSPWPTIDRTSRESRRRAARGAPSRTRERRRSRRSRR